MRPAVILHAEPFPALDNPEAEPSRLAVIPESATFEEGYEQVEREAYLGKTGAFEGDAA